MSIGIPYSPPFSRAFSFLSAKTYQGTFFVFSQNAPSKQFKSNVRETWRVILVSEADMFLSESLRILAERLSQSEINISHNNQLLVISLPTYRILSHLSFFCNIFFFSNIYFVCQSTCLRICSVIHIIA